MLLAIDVGNTQIKGAVFEQNTLLQKEIIVFPDWKKSLRKILKNFPNIKNLVVSSVGKLDKDDFLEFNSEIKIEFISKKSKTDESERYNFFKVGGGWVIGLRINWM